MLHLDCSISPNGGYYFSRPTKQNIGELWYIAVPYTHKDLTIVELGSRWLQDLPQS